MTEHSATIQAKEVSSSHTHSLLLQRKCACGTHTPGGGGCAECAKNRGRLQRKLRIGASDDSFETEADRIADQVTSIPAHFIANSPPPKIRRHTMGADSAQTLAPDSVDRVLASPGRPLDPALRADMEQRFEHDFSEVRVHTDSTAAQSAKDVAARAYTVGRDVVFDTNQFAPHSDGGYRLLAHELAHVVQQGLGVGHPVKLQREERDPDELAAETKEDAAIVSLAQRALKEKNRGILAQEVVWRLINNHRFDEHFELSGSRYEAKQTGVSVDFGAKKKVRSQGTVVIGDEALQRVANNQSAAVIKQIQAQIGKVDAARGGVDYVFIMGRDAPRTNNPFYTEAVKYFKAEYPSATMFEDVRDLEGINQRINGEQKPVANLIIVSHAHPDGTLQFSLNPTDKTPHRVQYSELKEANDQGSLTQPKPDLVGFWTNVSLRGCNLGRNEDMLDEVRRAFGGDARVIAPTHEQGYGGGKQFLAGPYYEEPGLSKLSDYEAFKRIKAKPEYAFITDWDAMRGKLRRFNDSSEEIAYEGIYPKQGSEIDIFKDRNMAKQLPKGASAANFKFASSSVAGDSTVFTFAAKDKFKFGDLTVPIPTPPDDKHAIDIARATVARPDSFQYHVRRTYAGQKLRVTVSIQRTEWELYHADIRKRGKVFNPTQGTKPWFGDTQ